MRVIGGRFKSRRLAAIGKLPLRPTSDRLRETLFDVLTAGNPQKLQGSQWLDLFAGTGAVGIEAISRGARQVTFVESSKTAVMLILKNLASLGIEAGFTVLQESALDIDPGSTAFDYVFLDPPYEETRIYSKLLQQLSHSQILTSATTVVAEHSRRFDPGPEHGALQRYRILEQGDAALSFYHTDA